MSEIKAEEEENPPSSDENNDSTKNSPIKKVSSQSKIVKILKIFILEIYSFDKKKIKI